jgi:peptidoglycan-N-acetylglucosamine deacetylase
MYDEGGFFNLMGHPQIIGRPSRMRMLERVIRQIRAKGDIWFAPPLEVANFWKRRGAD